MLAAAPHPWIDRQAARCLRNHARLFAEMETVALERRRRADSGDSNHLDALLLNPHHFARPLRLVHRRLRRQGGTAELRFATVRLESADAFNERQASAMTVGQVANEYARGAILFTTYAYAKSGRPVPGPTKPERWGR